MCPKTNTKCFFNCDQCDCKLDYPVKPKPAGHIRTFTGKMVNPLDMRPEDIDIRDIAHGLSNICRYNGQCKRFYSVAEHSVHVANMVPEPYRLAALLHDASEAYLGDLSTALKHSYAMTTYREIEHDIEETIAEVFGTGSYFDSYEAIKAADVLLYGKEKWQLFDGPFTDEDIHPKRAWAAERAKLPWRMELRCYRPEDAEGAFMYSFYKYKAGSLKAA